MQEILIRTTDGITLSGLWGDRKARKSVLLLHMMPATKENWEPLADELYAKGFNVLAIDFRGHGKSSGGDYTTFKDEEHQKYFIDARAALSWLEDTYQSTQIMLVGASIGANISLQCMAHDQLVKRCVCLSAGLDYYGVKSTDFVTQLQPDQSVLFIASHDDVRKSGLDCATQAEQLYALATSKKEKSIYPTGGHGTELLETYPELFQTIATFLSA